MYASPQLQVLENLAIANTALIRLMYHIWGTPMTRDKFLRVRLNQREFEKLKAVAKEQDVPISEVVRDLIKKLPDPKHLDRQA